MSEFGQREHDARKADLAEYHAGNITLYETQRRANERRVSAGLTIAQVDRALRKARINRNAT